MKKIFIIICSLVIAFTSVYATNHNQADAFISKLLGISAKKVVKEVIKDIATETAVNMALNEAFQIAAEQQKKYDVQDAYKVVCLYKMTGEVCDKPTAIKMNLTEADKILIGTQAELELEKLITNGRGFTTWEKFLDWFGPIWVTALAATALTYALDSDTRSLFNEAGYNALVALGFIAPVNSSEESLPLKDIDLEMVTKTEETPTHKSAAYVTNSASSMGIMENVNYPRANTILETYWYAKANPSITLFTYTTSLNNQNLYVHDRNTFNLYNAAFGTVYEVTGAKNGLSIQTVVPVANGYTDKVQAVFTNPEISNTLWANKTTSVRTRLPYKLGDFYYTDVLYNTVDGNTFEWQIKHSSSQTGNFTTWISAATHSTSEAKNTRITAYFNQTPNKKILVPVYTDVEQGLDLSENSSYDSEDGQQIALVPPAALPHTRISTGERVSVEPNPTPDGEPIYRAPDGTIVPDDDVEIGDPVITESPSGEPQVTPNPDPSGDPTTQPQPIPLVPTPPPTSPPTTGTPSPPPEDGGGGKPNIPLSLLIGLFKLLFAIIFYLVRLFTFIVTIQMIPPVPIPNPAFIWFTEVTILGIKPYSFIINTATFFLSFSIYKSIRRVFP